MTRVSDNYRFDSVYRTISQAKLDGERAMETAVSGSRIHKISDEPATAVRLIKNDTQVKNIDQYLKNVTFAKSFMAKSEEALRSMLEALNRTKELAIQQANSTYDEASHKAVAQEVGQLSKEITNLGNSSYADRYVFGGFRTSTPPISPDGLYLGDDGVIFIQLDEDMFQPINILGREIFGPTDDGSEESLISTINNFKNSLEKDNKPEIFKSIDALAEKINRVIDAVTKVGAREVIVDGMTDALAKKQEYLSLNSNQLDGADPIKAAMDLKKTEHTIDYALTASSKVMQPTLLNFLK